MVMVISSPALITAMLSYNSLQELTECRNAATLLVVKPI